MKPYWIAFALLTCLAPGCQNPINPATAPDSGQAIAGTYAAKSTTSFAQTTAYPINGKTMTIQISRLSADTVQVRLQAPANGLYSPAKDTTYAKVYVLAKPPGYYLTLEKPLHPQTAENQLIISPTTATYVFVPPTYTLGGVSALFTKAN